MDSLKSTFAKLTEQEKLTCAPDICNNVQSNTGMSDSVHCAMISDQTQSINLCGTTVQNIE